MKKYLYIGIGVVMVVALGFIIPPPDGFYGATDDTTIAKLETKYNTATEIKAKYSLTDGTLERKIVKNAELDAYKHEPKDEIIVTIGNKPDPEKLGADVKNFEPSITLSRWSEVDFKITPDISGVALKDRTLTFNQDKVIFDTPKVSYEMYDVAPNTENPEGAYKYVWYLNEAPATNKVSFRIETSGLDFFYQPPLTQEYQNGYSEEFQKDIIVSETQVKDLEGNVLVERPENVVGSYAVYHQTKGGMNDINGKEYKAGKAFHIYRPHIIDAKGAETWGILNIENGIYSVEIPQDFLDNAVYPIKSNDTFGYTGAGASKTEWNTNAYPIGSLNLSLTATTGDTVTKIQLSADGTHALQTSTVTANLGVYSIVSGLPKTLLNKSVISIADGSAKDWAITADLSWALTNAVVYNVALGELLEVTNYSYIYYDTGTGTNRSLHNTLGDLPTTWSSSGTSSTRYSIYATYTPSGGGAVVEDPPIIIIVD
jgi:hypothetical protein